MLPEANVPFSAESRPTQRTTNKRRPIMEYKNSVSALRAVGVLALLLSLGVLLTPQEVRGQYWLRTVSVVTPVEDRPVKAFLDTLVNVMERREGLKVKRAPEQQKIELSRLKDRLVEEDGVALSSATDLFITYRFSDSLSANFREEILSFYFVFRAGPSQEDIPIMYLDARAEWVKEIMNNKAMGLPTNEAPLLPFRREFQFLRIARLEDAQVVEIGDEPIRENFQRRKQALVNKIRRLAYKS